MRYFMSKICTQIMQHFRVGKPETILVITDGTVISITIVGTNFCEYHVSFKIFFYFYFVKKKLPAFLFPLNLQQECQ